MSEFPHLRLVRLQGPIQRRKRRFQIPPLNPRGDRHGGNLLSQLENVISEREKDLPPQFVDTSLIFRVRMEGSLQEAEWDKLGMTLLSSDESGSIVVFSPDDDASKFKERLEIYNSSERTEGGNRRYASFCDGIKRITKLIPSDRIGMRFRKEGINELVHFGKDEDYLVDIELWDFGEKPMKQKKVDEIENFIRDNNGNTFDSYVGPSITIIRAQFKGKLFLDLLKIEEIAHIDRPPTPNLDVSEFVEMEQDGAPEILPPDDDAPIVGILDSGVNAHPFIASAIIGSMAFPEEIGTFDYKGHGTMVAGVAAFGDLREIKNREKIKPSVRIISARLLGNDDKFSSQQTLPKLTRIAIESLHKAQCRIFVISLGDKDEEKIQGRVGSWAVTLDELAKELDVLIFVSAGNRTPRCWDPEDPKRTEEAMTGYPSYLLEPENLIIEPAGACNVVTVGALSNGKGLGVSHRHDAHIHAFTNKHDPAPFTCRGPGGGGVCKPDFVDIGGTAVFDAVTASLKSAPKIPEAGVITLHYKYSAQLLTSSKGTSVAAPMLARKASELLRVFPSGTANLIRAFLVGASSVPFQCAKRLDGMSDDDKKSIHGNGLVEIGRAVRSNNDRVILYAEDSIEVGGLAVYKLPVPPDFAATRDREIRVSLAFDPPVRRTRVEYIGTKMSFKLVRGKTSKEIFDRFGLEDDHKDEVADIEKGFGCILEPGVNRRKRNTLQTASKVFRRRANRLEEDYHLVVECTSGWEKSQEILQGFAVVVELLALGDLFLYQEVSNLRERQLRQENVWRQRV